MDTLELSRLQFALNISFHILFPTLTIALCWFLFFFKLKFDITKNPVWMRIYRFWVKIFALCFALGVVSGVTMSFQFGTNWPGFMEKVGNVAGPLLGYEVLTAFFLEATFLSVMLFGMHRVPNKIHTLATFIVAVGTTLSAFWILSLNSWMQTPAGYEWRDGVAHVTSWSEVIFNPSMPYRLAHMLIASGLSAAFLIAGISAYRILKGDTKHAPRLSLKVAIVVASVLIPLQILVGDLHGLNTLKHQPQKIAAIEGVWHTQKGAPLLLFAWPNETLRKNQFEIGIPKLASFILTHDLNGEVVGLNEFKDAHPPVKPVFFSFRVMLATGVIMLLLAWLGVYFYLRKKNLPQWYLKALVGMTFSGWIATLAGWYVSEVGRQPYLVNGLLTTESAVAQISGHYVALTLISYAAVYLLLLLAFVHTLFLMARRSTSIEEYSKAVPDKPGSDITLGGAL